MTNTDGNGPRVALYTRTSYEERLRGSESNDAQLRRLRLWVEHEGWRIVAEFGDDDWSGKLMSRPGLNRVRELARGGGVEYVLTTKRDRLMRDGRRRQDLDEELAAHGTRARAQSGESDDPGPFGRYMNRQMDAFAELEREVIAERMQTGKREKALKGQVIGNTLPGYGYRYADVDGEKRRHFEVDEEHMIVVRLIFDLIGRERASIKGVTRELERRNVTSPPTRTNPEGGRAWSRRTIRAIVLDDKYRPHDADELRVLRHPESSWKPPEGETRGVLWWNRTSQEQTKIPDESRPKGYRTHTKTIENPPAEHIAIPVPDAGLPRELVDAAREAIKDNRRAPLATGDRFRELSHGVLLCAECGARMVGNNPTRGAGGRERHARYRCPTYQHRRERERRGKSTCAHSEQHRADELESVVWRHVSELLNDPERIVAGLDDLILQEREVLQADPDADVSRWARRVEELEDRKTGYWELAADGDISREFMRAKVAEIDGEMEGVRRDLAASRNRGGRLKALETMRAGYSGDLLRDAFADLPDAPVDEIQGRMMEMVREKRRECILDAYTPEQRHEEYRRLGVKANVSPDGSLELTGIFDLGERVNGDPYTARRRTRASRASRAGGGYC